MPGLHQAENDTELHDTVQGQDKAGESRVACHLQCLLYHAWQSACQPIYEQCNLLEVRADHQRIVTSFQDASAVQKQSKEESAMKIYVIQERVGNLFYHRLHGFNFVMVPDVKQATHFDFNYDLLNTIETLRIIGIDVVKGRDLNTTLKQNT